MHVIAALTVGLLLALSTSAPALVLCQKKRAVLARASCRTGETPLSLVGLGALGAPGAAGAQGSAGPTPLKVVDAVGTEVGPLVHAEDYLVTAIVDQETAVYLALTRRPPLDDGALLGLNAAGRPTGRIFYADANCGGTPLFQGFGLMTILHVVGETVFGPAGVSPTTSVASVEVNDTSQGCVAITPRGGCCRSFVTTGAFANATAVTTLPALGIVPPLRAVAK